MKPALVIFGLGNPGKGYAITRHNLGFRAVDALAESFGEGEWKDSQKFLGSVLEARVGVAPVLLVKPRTYMNRSADCIRKVAEFYRLDPRRQILVVSDDIDLPLGEVRLRMKGGPGTHNGLRSVVDVFGEEFPRIRIGLGSPPPGADLSNWVLSALTQDELSALETAFRHLPEVVSGFVLEKGPVEEK